MLQIKNIKKQYTTGEFTQTALNSVSLNFRNNEFISILGPSGSGKTTLLNIIGGLDSYDEGDLIINGTSTKNYKDRDWDTYRNHAIGFVFQSYNLIPHQTLLSNVELALTIGGISKSERKKRAFDALSKVGLADHVNKRPNQLSGGQMQRVAIARALVNDPDILLADEPTGALDTTTSVQIMELLKEVANDRLVVMVTHNPELAKEYSSRIVNLKDGNIIDDSNPYIPTEEQELRNVKETTNKKTKRAKMSLKTALVLSANNLKTKKSRTLLTSFAGSIGIIGIALILSLSNGVNTYIDDLQKETMGSYPITISAESMNMTGMTPGPVGSDDENVEKDAVNWDTSMLEAQNSLMVTNNLTEFKKYLDNPDSDINQYLGEDGVIYTYDPSFDVLSYNNDDKLINTSVDPSELVNSSGTMDAMMQNQNMMISMMSGTGTLGATNFAELTPGADGETVNAAITDSYDLAHGNWPTESNEVVLFLDENYSIDVDVLYQLGLMTADEYTTIIEQIENDEELTKQVLNFEDVTNHTFYMVPESDRYVEGTDGKFTYLQDDALVATIEDKTALNIVGIAIPSEDATTSFASAIGYTNALTTEIIELSNNSDVVVAQNETPEVNVLTGVNFEAANDEQKVEDTITYLTNLPVSEKASFYNMMMYSSGQMSMPQDEATSAAMLDAWLANDPDEESLLSIYDETLGNASYESNLKDFGQVSYDAPSAINIYTDSFENKDAVALAIEEYNANATAENQIIYTDFVELLTSSITTIIDVISYVLIAFVSVSLIVSSIMIGIITHISVMERTKEIGVLRALGASKKNISQVFNAETIIIGICSGLLGVGITLLLNIPITAVIQSLLGDTSISVGLPLVPAVILVALSMFITVLGGLLPAKNAAKKDPVVALRSE